MSALVTRTVIGFRSKPGKAIVYLNMPLDMTATFKVLSETVQHTRHTWDTPHDATRQAMMFIWSKAGTFDEPGVTVDEFFEPDDKVIWIVDWSKRAAEMYVSTTVETLQHELTEIISFKKLAPEPATPEPVI